MLNAFIIVWRESLEAMLVIGVLLAWIARQPNPAHLRRSLWLGTTAGIALAALLGYATFALQSQFSGESLEIFQLFMMLLTSALIVQMVFWMYRHGRNMKRQLEVQAESTSNRFGIGAIAALAVAREGAETVVFLYGLTMESGGKELGSMLIASIVGLVLAMATCAFVVRGARYFSYRTLFAVSGILLLFIANAMLANSMDRLIGMDWLPPLLDPVWDTTGLLDDRMGLGHVLADFIGYRARPTGMLLIAMIAFWLGTVWRMYCLNQKANMPETKTGCADAPGSCTGQVR